MEYKETAEYAFDVLEHEYNKFQSIIELAGAYNFCVMIPSKLQENLKCCNVYNGYMYPVKYRGMDIIYTSVDKPLFVLKERQSCD